MQTEHFIPGIYNYCDRWCERCRFIRRCAIGSVELQRIQRGEEYSIEELWDNIGDNLREALSMLDELMKEAGFSPEDLEDFDAEALDPMIEAKMKKIQRRGLRYAKAMSLFFSKNEALLKTKGIDLNAESTAKNWGVTDKSQLVEAVEVINWYAYLPFVKAERAISGIPEMEDDDQDPIQSDANGSAKIAMIASEMTLVAWDIVKRHIPSLVEEVYALQKQLSLFRKVMNRQFPHWNDFVRQGFDTEPEVPPFGAN